MVGECAADPIAELISRVSEQERTLAEKQALLHSLLSQRDAVHRARESLTSVINRNADRLHRIVVLIDLKKILDDEYQNEDYRQRNSQASWSYNAVEVADYELERFRVQQDSIDSIEDWSNHLNSSAAVHAGDHSRSFVTSSAVTTHATVAPHAAAARPSEDDVIPDPPAADGRRTWHPASALISAGADIRGLPLWHACSGEAVDPQLQSLFTLADTALHRERIGGGGGGGGGGFFVVWETMEGEGAPRHAAPKVRAWD
jgi:hypothetical protein